MDTLVFETPTRLGRAEAWRHITSPAGVNAEFRPFLRMTFPDRIEDLAQSWSPGETLFRSWILLFGLLPIEYDDLAFVEVDEAHRFLERSQMLLVRIWQHERVLLAGSEGVRIRDEVRFEPRFAPLAPIQRGLFRLLFRYRHFRLRRLFGATGPHSP